MADQDQERRIEDDRPPVDYYAQHERDSQQNLAHKEKAREQRQSEHDASRDAHIKQLAREEAARRSVPSYEDRRKDQQAQLAQEVNTGREIPSYAQRREQQQAQLAQSGMNAPKQERDRDREGGRSR